MESNSIFKLRISASPKLPLFQAKFRTLSSNIRRFVSGTPYGQATYV